MKIKSRRAQNEIVGFVIIVVIVIIIGLFFLVYYLRQDPVKIESKNVDNFLKASLSYTTECKVYIEPLNMQRLIKRCYDGGYCKDTGSCEILNETFSELLEQAWRIEDEQTVNYYHLNIYYREGDGEDVINEPILGIGKGNCTGSESGAEEFFKHGQGNIFVTLNICYI